MYTELPKNSEYARREYAGAVNLLAQSGFFGFEKKADVSPLADALGAPLNLNIPAPFSFSQEYVGCDDLCEIFRLRIMVLPSLPFYGLMFVPHNIKAPAQTVIATHGHLGTPELMYGMHGKNGYSDLIRRLLAHNVVVFSPQLLLWNYGFNPAKPHYETKYNRVELDAKLKLHGGSITALETFCILRSVTALQTIRTLDLSNLGVCGMSYGAFLTMRAMALDSRIKRGYFMSCFDGGLDPRFPEWRFRDGFDTLRDGEIAALCAPRPIFIEVGEYDDIFPPENAWREAQTTRTAYIKLNAVNNFGFSVWSGAHLVNRSSDGINFLINK